MSVYGGPASVSTGLVLNLDAANLRSYPGNGTTWSDLSLSKNTGTLTNSPTYSSAYKGCIIFDGIDDYVTMPQPSINLSPNLWTICIWMKPNDQYSRFLVPYSAGIDNFLEYDNTNQKVNIAITTSADINNRTRSGTNGTIPVNNWSFSCISMNNLDIKIYANGLLTNSYTEIDTIANWESTWYLGQRGNSTYWYSGAIANLIVYNRELSAAEVLQNYQALRGRYGL